MATRLLRIGFVLFWFAFLGLVIPPAQAAPEAPPVNDNFSNAIDINGDSGSLDGTTVAATKESGEPNHAGKVGGKSIWYEWLAPTTQAVLFTTYGSSFDTLLGVYTGASVNTLSEVVSNDECMSGLTSCVVIHATSGTTYWIAIDGYGGASGAVHLEWAVPPANDDFANAAYISGATGKVNGTVLHATKEPGEPNHAGFLGGVSVWYQWTAPAANRIRFSVSTNGFSPVSGIYTGNGVNALTKVLEASDCATADYYYDCFVFNAVGGTTYYLAIDSATENAQDFVLEWGVPPANDDFENAQGISGATGKVNGTLAFATAQPGEPGEGWGSAHASVWYKWTAPASARMRFDTEGSGTNMYLDAFTGTHIEELVPVSSVAFCQYASGCVKFNAIAGTTYRFRVDVNSGTALTLNWQPLVPPANDDFANALVLDANSGQLQGTTIDATKEAGEPDHANLYGISSVWYKWTAPINGRARFLADANFNAVLGIYTGSAVNALTRVDLVGDDAYDFQMVQGTTYAIAVDGYFDSSSGQFTLNWNCPVTAKPSLYSPKKGARLKANRVFLRWESDTCASHYEITVRTGSRKGPVAEQAQDLTEESYHATNLAVGVTYFWRVQACSAFQCKPSAWRSFTVKP